MGFPSSKKAKLHPPEFLRMDAALLKATMLRGSQTSLHEETTRRERLQISPQLSQSPAAPQERPQARMVPKEELPEFQTHNN